MSFHLSTDKPPTCPMIQLFGNSAGHCGAMPKLGEPTEPGAGYTSGAALLRTVLARNAIANTSVAHRPRPVSSLVRSTLNMFPWISIHPPGKMVLMTELASKEGRTLVHKIVHRIGRNFQAPSKHNLSSKTAKRCAEIGLVFR